MQITAAYFLIQSWLFYEVCSSPVTDVNPQLSESQRLEGLALSGHMDDDSESEEPFTSSSTTFPPQRHGEAKTDSNLKSVVLRLKRRSSPCVLKKTIRWNDCLGRFYIKLHCRSQSVGCYSPNNVPPKCQKKYQAIPAQSGYCRILTSCTCAAWRHSTPRLCATWRHPVLGSWNSFPLCFSL